jgi:hypothetical protein
MWAPCYGVSYDMLSTADVTVDRNISLGLLLNVECYNVITVNQGPNWSYLQVTVSPIYMYDVFATLEEFRP